MKSLVVLGLVGATMFTSLPASAQSVQQCLQVTRQVEREIDRIDLYYFAEGLIGHLRGLQQRALSAAAKGNGPKCMRLAQQALRVASR